MKVNKILETMDYGTAPESSAAPLKWIEERGADFGLFINGAFEVKDGFKGVPLLCVEIDFDLIPPVLLDAPLLLENFDGCFSIFTEFFP